ncbi:MAG: helix-turn-helix domain-containing protein [Desulfomonilaceae bacterium]
MDDERFERMMEGVKQGADILKGVCKPYREYKVSVQVPEVKNIRQKLNLSQSEFAEMLGISLRTLQNWEQKHRLPKGPARILLEIAASYPDQVRQVSLKISGQKSQKPNFTTHHEDCSNIA